MESARTALLSLSRDVSRSTSKIESELRLELAHRAAAAMQMEEEVTAVTQQLASLQSDLSAQTRLLRVADTRLQATERAVAACEDERSALAAHHAMHLSVTTTSGSGDARAAAVAASAVGAAEVDVLHGMVRAEKERRTLYEDRVTLLERELARCVS